MSPGADPDDIRVGSIRIPQRIGSKAVRGERDCFSGAEAGADSGQDRIETGEVGS